MNVLPNTLKNLDALLSEQYAYKSIRDTMDRTERETRIYQKFMSAAFSPSVFKTEADRLDREMKNCEIALEVAKGEWKLTDAYLRIYQVQIKPFYQYLTGDPAADFFDENTLGGYELGGKTTSEAYSEYRRLEKETKEQKEAERGCDIHGERYSRELEEKTQKAYDYWQNKSKILRLAEQQWEKLKAFVKSQDWTASEYAAVIKEYLDK